MTKKKFESQNCGPARLCPDNAVRVTALVTVGGAFESTGLAAESGADLESESACQAGLTPSQPAEMVTRTRA
jgi:hypothetical protein